MMKLEFYIPSSRAGTRLHGIQWLPDVPVIASLQICHGMIEHVGRYEELAEYLCRHGIAAAGCDHLGHGRTSKPEDWGFFDEKDGELRVLEDIQLTSDYLKRQYPSVPHFILGHSMGSFFLRCYMGDKSSEIDGAILLGTGGQRPLLAKAGRLLTEGIAALKGDRYRSRLLHQLLIGRFGRMTDKKGGSHCWLSREEEQVRMYTEDPLNQFIFTSGACRDFMKIITLAGQKNGQKKIRRGLPIFLMSGAQDPVGERGRGVRRVYKAFKQTGLSDVSLKLYPEARHELLHETNREEVFRDIEEWIRKRIP
ncbi:MAG: alpha/beta hydrolase [Clostridium sp.]|nr:alpha/beta hydrolase [Clostridium sp.]